MNESNQSPLFYSEKNEKSGNFLNATQRLHGRAKSRIAILISLPGSYCHYHFEFTVFSEFGGLLLTQCRVF